jgi:serine/threonine-protein kinase
MTARAPAPLAPPGPRLERPERPEQPARLEDAVTLDALPLAARPGAGSVAPTLRRDAPESLPHAPTEIAAAISEPRPVDAAPSPLEDHGFDARYDVKTVLGAGGMGEVRLIRDQRIGREVAMKVMHPGYGSRSDARTRFEREARVQGQLEHPAIVPVYDLGVAPDGAAYFTMKRLRGHTFASIVEGLRANDARVVEQFSLRKLLGAFQQLSLAVAFAHARGVLHRDLKPANLMLGDFGEVYVLDWGLAKIAGEPDEPAPAAIGESDATSTTTTTSTPGPEAPSRIALDGPVGAQTAVGAIMGTPGYMPPEQVRGEVLDARADVYALGAILFELLTLKPLHDRPTVEATMMATLLGADARASALAPDRAIAPELEAICVRATATERDDRYPSVRALIDDLESFLDGDRDLERRRELARAHVEVAQAASVRARTATGTAGASARAEAMREVNRALALDAGNGEAVALVARLLLDPPKEAPAEVENEVHGAIASERRNGQRIGAWAYLSWFLVVPILLHMGIRSWPMWAVTATAIASSAALSFYAGWRRESDSVVIGTIILAVSMFGLAATAMLFGPFMLVPGMVATNTLVFAMHTDRGPMRAWTIALGAFAILIPFALELFGVLPPSMEFRDGALAILPRLTAFKPGPTMLFLLISNVALVVIPAMLVARLRDDARRAERRLLTHLWHLRQVMPDAAQDAARVPDAPLLDACEHSTAVAAAVRNTFEEIRHAHGRAKSR